jgi:hypothetical protein
MKAIMVFEMPTSCRECPAYMQLGCRLSGKPFSGSMRQQIASGAPGKPGWCQLRPAPELRLVWRDDDAYGYGWNDALRKAGLNE